MTMFFNHAWLILRRDLQIEFRKKSLLLSMIFFSILIQVVLTISFDANTTAMKSIASGLVWLPILLSAMIGFGKYGSAEKENDALTGLNISPMDPGAIFVGKLMGNLFLVLMVAMVSVPVFFLFMKQPFPESLPLLLITLFLGSWGFVALGLFLTTLASGSSITELLVPIMLFPLSVPLLIAVIKLTEIALFPAIVMNQSLWLTLLIGYDLIFTVIPLLLFELLLEV